ncbi:MAG: PQQ-binding-like beta-propeller repeat protein [Acidimicrobiales bacterium]
MIRRAAVVGVVAVSLLATGSAAPTTAGGPASSEWACPDWGMYGRTLSRTFATDCPSPINPRTVWRLAPAWFVDLPVPVTASPAVVGGVVYIGAWDGVLYALDARSGAIRWRYSTVPAPGAAFGPIVSSAAVTDVAYAGADTRRLVIVGAGPRVVAVDATDGREVWVHDASAGLSASPTEYEASPVVWNDLVLVGRDTHNEPGEATGGVRGGLVALDVRTGDVRWVFEPERDQPAAGCGGVWSSAAVDPELGLAFVGTANCPDASFAWTPYTNAVVAVDLASGEPAWSFQPSGPPDDDTDFGATPNLFVDDSGRAILGAGKKDGTYYALDRTTGALLWSTHVADPLPGVGGFIGSPAVWAGDVFGGTALGSPPYLHSLDGATGAVRWRGGVGPTYGASAVADGVVFNAALDLLLKAYDARTGRLLWAAPLAGPASSGPVVVGDMVFIGSGTSTSDLCAKDNPTDGLCVFLFDTVLASLGGIHAFRLLPAPLELEL